MEMESDCVIIDGHLLGHLTLSLSHTCEEQKVFTFLFLIMSKVIHILYVDRKRWECYFHLEILRMIVICWCKFTASKKLFNISSCLNVKYVNGKYVDAFYNI